MTSKCLSNCSRTIGIAIVAMTLCTTVHAQSPFGTTEGFEPAGDNDAFVPTNPVPPFVAAGHPGETPGVHAPLEDVLESRTGGEGLMEEVLSGFGGVTSHTGAGHSIVYGGVDGSYQAGGPGTSFRDGPFTRYGRQVAFPGSGSTWAYKVDLFAESVPSPGHSLDYFWWTNGAQDNDGVGLCCGGYLTESGFQIHPGAASWTFRTTGSALPQVNLPTGVWYHLEVVFERSLTNPLAPVLVHHLIFNADRTSLLFSHTAPAAFGALSGDLGGPRYSWFSVWNDDIVDQIHIDNLGTGDADAVIELVATDSCLNASENQLTVEVRMTGASQNVVGGQFFLQYDATRLSLPGGSPGSIVPGDAPFTSQVYECSPSQSTGSPPPPAVCTPTAGLIDFAVGVSPFNDPGTSADTVLARITFDVIAGAEACSLASLVSFRANNPPTLLSNSFGQPVASSTTDLHAITIDQVAPVITCGADITVNADAGSCAAAVALTSPVVETFDSNPTLSATQAPGVWYTDRYAPFGFASAFFDGDNRLRHSIDASDCSPCRGPSFSSSFYDTQGRKYDTPGATHMSIDLYVPSDWALTGRRMAGFWGTCFDSSNAVSFFPIIEFTSTSDGSGVARFRGWNGVGWTDMGLPTGFAYDAWYELDIQMDVATVTYTVGDLSLTLPHNGSVQIANVILQGHNNTAGVTYDIHWDNFTSGQGTFAYDNCTAAPSLVGVRSDALPLNDPYPAGVTTTITWTATDDCGNSSQCVQTVTVYNQNTAVATVELKSVFTPVSRAVTFEFFSGVTLMDTVCAVVSFTDHDSNGATPVRGTATFDVDCGLYDCITVRDTLHTLRRTISSGPEFGIAGVQYAIESTSDGANDDSLIGGNLNDDRFIDILDFGAFAGQFNANYGTGDTTCLTSPTHADFTGDGLVIANDYTYIANNFLVSREVSCDGTADSGGTEAGPITRISVKELIRRGMPELVSADFNHDGWLDTLDIQAFFNGGGSSSGVINR